MLHHYTQWKKSKQSKRAYCKQEGLSYYSFRRFCHAEHEPKGFTLLSSSTTVSQQLRFVLPNGAYFALPDDCSLELLQKLVKLC
jgi:hypothetical protein